MSFQVENQAAGEPAFRQDFTTDDFHAGGYQSEAFHYCLPGAETRGRLWIFDGIRMIHSDSTFSECADLAWQGDTEMVTMHFNLKGRVSVTDAETGKTFAFANNQHNLLYGRKTEGTMRNEAFKIRMFLVQFSKKAFFAIADNGNEAIRRFADVVAGDRAAAFSDANLPIDLGLRQCIDAVLRCPYADSLMRMYLRSKAIEMLVLQAESFDRAPGKKTRCSKRTTTGSGSCLPAITCSGAWTAPRPWPNWRAWRASMSLSLRRVLKKRSG